MLHFFVTILNIYYFCVYLFNSITEPEAKDVHRSLKVAAGIFKNLKVSYVYRRVQTRF